MITFLVICCVVATVRGDVDPGPKPLCPSDNSVEAYFATNDCTKFWQCSNGVPYLMPCGRGTHWSQELWTCVHIADSKCTGEGWSTTTKELPTTTTKSTTASPNAPGICPPVDGPDSVYFPDTDCTKFWQCSNGVPYKHSCPDGLHFNPVLNVCDWPERAGCNGTSPTRAPATTSAPTTASTDLPTSDPNAPGTCPPVDGPDSVYFPDIDCTKFWQCSNGVPYKHSCPDGLHFNPVLNVCDWPERAGCNGTSPTKAPATTSAPTAAPTDLPTSDPNAPGTCPPVDGPDSVYFPDTDCTKFWQCSNGVPYKHSCPDGLHFNRVLNVCDWPERAGCIKTPPTEAPSTTERVDSTTSEASVTTSVSVVTTTIAPPTTTDKVPGTTPACKPPATKCTCTCELIPEDEPSTTSVWTRPTTPTPEVPELDPEHTTNATLPSGQDSCDNLSSQCPRVDGCDPVYIPLAECIGFCQCSNGQAYYHPCPPGLHFNPTLNVCDYPYRAGCTGVSGTTSTPPAN